MDKFVIRLNKVNSSKAPSQLPISSAPASWVVSAASPSSSSVQSSSDISPILHHSSIPLLSSANSEKRSYPKNKDGQSFQHDWLKRFRFCILLSLSFFHLQERKRKALTSQGVSN